MSRVTNRVGVEALRDLLEGVSAGALAHVDARGAVEALPAALRWREGRFRIGLPGGTLRSDAGRLVVDDGWFWWELRAVLARGVLTPSATPYDASSSK